MSLRKKLIRLAHSQPELRKDLLPLLIKQSGINNRTIIWEYYGVGYEDEIEYRDDLMMKSFKTFPHAVDALSSLKREAKKKGFDGRGINFKRKGQNNMQAIVQADNGTDELFYHHEIKFAGFEEAEMKILTKIVSKW